MSGHRIGDLGRLKLAFSMRVTVPLVLYGAAATFILLFLFVEPWREELTFIGAAVGVATALQSAYFTRKAVEETVKDRELGVASDYFRTYYCDEAFKNLRQTYHAEIRPAIVGKSTSEVVTLLSSDGSRAQVVSDLLNFWEGVGYSARTGRVQIETVSALMRTAALRIFEDLQPWLVEYRRTKKQDTAWEHFEWLCQSLRTKK